MENVIPNRTPLVEFSRDKMIELVKSFSMEKLAAFLDVTDLSADTQAPKMAKMVKWAKDYGCASVCVNPVEGSDILPELCKGSKIKECYVIDFPLGKVDIELKAEMTSHTVKKSRTIRGEGNGNIELDMVINVGRFKKDWAYTLEEINAVCEAADGEHVKVIVRSAEMSEKEVYQVSEIVASSRADFIKNSTGMDAVKQIYPPNTQNVVDSVQSAGGILQPCITSIPENDSRDLITIGPNPVKTKAYINLHIIEAGDIELSIYNLTGQKVLDNGPAYYYPGDYTITADLTGKPKGFYFVQLKDKSGKIKTKKIILSE